MATEMRNIPPLPAAVSAYQASASKGFPEGLSRTALAGDVETYREQLKNPNSLLSKSFLSAQITYHLLQELEQYIYAQRAIEQEQANLLWLAYLELMDERMPIAPGIDADIDPTDETHEVDFSKLESGDASDELDAHQLQQEMLLKYAELADALDEESDDYLHDLGLDNTVKTNATAIALLKHQVTAEQAFANQPEKLQMYHEAYDQVAAILDKILNKAEKLSPSFYLAANYLAPAAVAAVVSMKDTLDDIKMDGLAQAIANKAQQIEALGDKLEKSLNGVLKQIRQLAQIEESTPGKGPTHG